MRNIDIVCADRIEIKGLQSNGFTNGRVLVLTESEYELFKAKRRLPVMSTNLYYRPLPAEPDKIELPFELKKAIAQRFWDHDGSLYGDEVRFDSQDIPYLNGLKHAGIRGAAQLINAIETHRAVKVWIGE